MCSGYLVAYARRIIESEPPATTTAGALRALDHVLLSDDLFFGRSESSDLQMLCLSVKAARDYVSSAAIRERTSDPGHRLSPASAH